MGTLIASCLLLGCLRNNNESTSEGWEIVSEQGREFAIREPLGVLKLSVTNRGVLYNEKNIYWSVDDRRIAEIDKKEGVIGAKRNGVINATAFISPDIKITRQIYIKNQLVDIGNHMFLHPNLNVVALTINENDFSDLNLGRLDVQVITPIIYSKFKDDFDFLFLISLNYGCPECSYAGRSTLVRNNVHGIGRAIFDSSEDFGSKGKLQSIIHLTHYKGLNNGTALHEMAHRWANYIIPTVAIDNKGKARPDSTHWGVSDASGVLGGFDPEVLKSNVEGDPTQYIACIGNGKSFGSFHNNHVLYSPIELYLMGLIPEIEVPELNIFSGVQCKRDDYLKKGLFSARGRKTFSIKDIVQIHGKRSPSYRKSQKKFKGLVVILTTASHPLSGKEWEFFNSQVKSFSSKNEVQRKDYNFYQATGGRAELKLDRLDKSLKGSPF